MPVIPEDGNAYQVPEGRFTARARLTPEDQRRIAESAARYGWTGAGLTLWLMREQVRGLPIEDALAATELAYDARQHPDFDWTVRVDAQGVRYRQLTVVADTADVPPPIAIMPVPGIEEWTIIFSVASADQLPQRPPQLGG